MREISRFTPNIEAVVTNLRRLTVVVGGARELRVGADGRIRPDGGGAGGAPAVRIRPYVSVFVVGKSGRRLEAPGLAVETGVPKPHLSAIESSPVWNESFQLALSAETLSQASALVLVVMDGGQRGLFGTSSSLLGAKTDVPLAQARMEWVELAAANMVEHEKELPLLDESGRKTGATLTVRTEMVDLVACRREAQTLEARLSQAQKTVQNVLGQRRLSDLRVRREGEILAHEMELDARQSASHEAAKIMKEMQTQLMSFVEAEELLCANAEKTVRAEIDTSVNILDGACEETTKVLHAEKHFYDQNAPALHEAIIGLLAEPSDEFIARAQQASLRHIRIASDGMSENLRMCESRLHQATDYQIVLQRESVERAKTATLAWLGLPAATVKDELAHGIATWQRRQQGLKAESLSAAAALHGALVETKVVQDDEVTRMRSRQAKAVDARAKVHAEFVEELKAEASRAEAEHEAAQAAVEEETARMVEAEEEQGRLRVAASREALARVDDVIAEVEASVRAELEVCEAHAQSEAQSRAQLVDDVYQRRLQRLCMWIAETEEDGRLLEETAVAEEEAAQRRDQGVTDDLGAISLVEARSRDLFDRARVEHITNVARMHDEVVPLFGQRQQAYEDEMHRIRDDLNALSSAAVGEHVATVKLHMGEVMRAAAALRVESRQKQVEIGTQLLVLHLEQIEHANEVNRQRVAHAYTDAIHSVRLRHAQISTSMEVALLRERNTQHLGFNTVFAQAAEASWGRERAQLLAAVGSIGRARQAACEKLVHLVEEQTLAHYSGLAQLAEEWAEHEAAEEASRLARETALVRQWEEEPVRTAQAQLASQKRLMADASAKMTADAEWFSTRLSEAQAEGSRRADGEVEMADELVHGALTEWRAQVAKGFEADTKAHHERLLASEKKAHAECVSRAQESNQRMERMRDECAKLLDASEHREQICKLRLENARAAAREVSERTRAKLDAAHEALHAAFERTKAVVQAAATASNERVLKRQHELASHLSKASVDFTVLVESAARERHDQLLRWYDFERGGSAAAVAEMRATGLRSQEAECRAQINGEEELASQVAAAKQSAREAHEAAMGEEKEALDALRSEWRGVDEATRRDTLSRALEWQKRASNRYTSQLAATWGRQLVHHANLCRETQRARRLAFEKRKQKRLDAVRHLEETFHNEQRESEAIVSAARAALEDEVARVPEAFSQAAQRAVDSLTARQLRTASEELQHRYDAAAEAERRQLEVAEDMMSAGAESSGLLLAELSASARHSLGPPPNDFVRHAVASHLVHDEEVSNAIAWTAHWEGEQAAAMRDGVERQVADGLASRRQRQREAAVEMAGRQAAREAETRQKAEEAELARLAGEERRLASLSAEELEAAAQERAAQAQLEWEARSLGAAAADETRKDVDAVCHQRRIAKQQQRRQGLVTSAKASAEAAAATGVPAAAAQLDLTGGAGLRGEPAVLSLLAANKAKAELGKSERAGSGEAFSFFQQSMGAMEAKRQAELARVVEETRVRREAQLAREIERASASLTEQLAKLSSAQLLAVTDGLSERLARCADRSEYETCVQQKRLLDTRTLSAKDFLSGSSPDAANVSAAAANLRAAKLRLENSISEADARLVQAEIAARLAAETPVQRQLREQMVRSVHKLSGVFAAADASGDGIVDVAEFRRVLPIMAIDGATDADADAVFFTLSRGRSEVAYRDLFLELSRVQRQLQAEQAAKELSSSTTTAPGDGATPQPRSATPTKRTPAASGSATPANKPTPRAASAGPKARPAAGGAKKATTGGAAAKPAAGGAKKAAAAGARSASAPRGRK